jgi:4-hydroxybenzoate polyprenyltransferase
MLEKISLYLDLIRWNRPAGWVVLLWPTLSALWVAADGFPGWHLLGVFVLGTFLMRSAGCCVNDVADRDFDRHVRRTAQLWHARQRTKARRSLKTRGQQKQKSPGFLGLFYAWCLGAVTQASLTSKNN